MTFEEIIQELKNQEIDIEDFAYGKIENPLPNIGEWSKIYQKGGTGQGDEWYSVKYFPEHDVYIKVEGFYSSYSGVNFYNKWDGCFNVKPVEKTIMVFE